MLLSEFLKRGVSALETLYPTQEARSIMFMLCEYRLGTKNYTHIVEPQYAVPEDKQAMLDSDLERLSGGEPVQYVLGSAVFYDLDFHVAPGVLIPRGETELLVERAVSIVRKMQGLKSTPVKVLDLCTGSGCIAWSVALNAPGCEVTAVDISDEALSIASNQTFEPILKDRNAVAPTFVKADVLDPSQAKGFSEFDIILSNPPYIMDSEKSAMRVNVLEHEPHLALFVPDSDPLVFYKAIADWSKTLLSENGECLSEINEMLGQQTESVFRSAGFSSTEVVKDYFGKDRFVYYTR